MHDRIEAFIEFLLDTETTSEIVFSQTILKKHEFYNGRYQSNFAKVVELKLKHWQDFSQNEQHAITDRMVTLTENEVSDNESDEEIFDEEETKPMQQKEKVSLHCAVLMSYH